MCSFRQSKIKTFSIKQECIPVGCVPAARRPYAGVCFPGGVCLVWGGSAWSGGCAWPGGCAWSGGWCLPGWGVSAWSGGCAWLGGCAWSGGRSGIPACTEADTLPPVDRHTPVKTLPWPQLRCGR